MLSEDIKNYAFAVRAMDALHRDTDEELTIRLRRLLEAKITEAEEGTDRPPQHQNYDNFSF